MQLSDLYVAGVGLALPPEVTVDDAIEHGLYDADEAARTQLRAATVLPPGQGIPDLAVTAARDALRQSRHAPSTVGIVSHGVALHAGLDAWNSAAHIQHELDIYNEDCVMLEVRSGCNGLAALQVACTHLKAEPAQRAALVTCADAWPLPGFDRWRAEPGIIYGDGASAAVISRETGFARIRALRTVTDVHLAGLHRGRDPFGAFRSGRDAPIDLHRRSLAFRDQVATAEIWQRYRHALRKAVTSALADAGATLTDVRHYSLPFLGAPLLRPRYEWLELTSPSKTTWEFGRRVGHIGVADALAGLHDLHRSGRLQPGDLTMLIGEGGGYVCTVVIVESVAD